MKRLLLTSLLLSGCTLTYSHAAAMSNEHMSERVLSTATEADLVQVAKDLAELGYAIVTRVDGSTRLTTLPGTVLIPKDFDERPLPTRIRVLRHELVHAKQWESLGELIFGAAYADLGGRFEIEGQGYRQQIRDLYSEGYSFERIDAAIEKVSTSFPTGYKYPAKHQQEIEDAMRKVLTAELEFCKQDDVFTKAREGAMK